MKIMIDSNVMIDYVIQRQPFADLADQIIDMCERGRVKGHITASTITDIYYVIKKNLGDQGARNALHSLTEVFVLDVTRGDVLSAHESPVRDFEDALLAECAKRSEADYIITRNIRDFEESPVPAVEPSDFIDMMEGCPSPI